MTNGRCWKAPLDLYSQLPVRPCLTQTGGEGQAAVRPYRGEGCLVCLQNNTGDRCACDRIVMQGRYGHQGRNRWGQVVEGGSVISVELVVDSQHINISIVYTMSRPTFTSNTIALTGSCVTLLSKRTAYVGYMRANELLKVQSVMI